MAIIVGIGQWTPPEVRDNSHWPQEFRDAFARRQGEAQDFQPTDVDPLVARYSAHEEHDPFLGSIARRVADDAMTAQQSEVLAGQAALVDAGIDPADIGAVLSSAVAPDSLWATGAGIAHSIGATKAWSAGFDVACASSVVALDIAAALVDSDRVEYVLLTQSNLWTRMFPTMHPLSPSVGDGATALIVTRRRHKLSGLEIDGVHSVSHGDYADAVLIKRHPSEPDTRWYEAGGPMSMGSRDPDKARALVRDTVKIAAQTIAELAAKVEWDFDPATTDVFCSVQPRKWIPYAIAERCGIPSKAVVETFSARAHMGAVGPIANLLQARSEGALRPGARVVLYGQGAGFTRSAALLVQT